MFTVLTMVGSLLIHKVIIMYDTAVNAERWKCIDKTYNKGASLLQYEHSESELVRHLYTVGVYSGM